MEAGVADAEIVDRDRGPVIDQQVGHLPQVLVGPDRLLFGNLDAEIGWRDTGIADEIEHAVAVYRQALVGPVVDIAEEPDISLFGQRGELADCPAKQGALHQPQLARFIAGVKNIRNAGEPAASRPGKRFEAMHIQRGCADDRLVGEIGFPSRGNTRTDCLGHGPRLAPAIAMPCNEAS